MIDLSTYPDSVYHLLQEPDGPLCTIGIIGTNSSEIETAIAGLIKAGFSPDQVRLLVIRNFEQNYFDPYDGIRRFIADARGRFLMVIHQDVTPIDSFEQLLSKLDNLARIDPDWAVAGNSGFIRPGRLARRISDPYGTDQHVGVLPAKVMSLDENLLILNMTSPVKPSEGLSGFHFYGTDLVLQAYLQNRGSYVIDWHVYHASKGSMNKDWKQGLTYIEAVYNSEMPSILVQTPTTLLAFGLWRPLRLMRKTAWRLVRHGSRWMVRLGLRR